MIIPFFKTGVHEDSAGNTHKITTEELDRRVKLYNEQLNDDDAKHEAPVVIGHPSTNAPAFGWVSRLFREKNELFAETRDEAPEFRDWLEKKRYKKVSGSFYANGLLRHVGFLGAVPPAIKGLPDFSFAEGDTETFEFAADDWNWRTVKRVFQRFREWIIEQKDIETADKIVSQWDIDALEPPKEPLLEASNSLSYKEHTMPNEESQALQAKLVAAETLAAQEKALRLAAEQKAASITAEQRRAQFAAFCESDDLKGRITPAMRPRVIAIMQRLDAGKEQKIEFAEGDNTKQADPVEAFQELLKGLDKQVEFREVVAGSRAAVAEDPQVLAGREIASFTKK